MMSERRSHQPGLEVRMHVEARRIASQHRQLAEMRERAVTALQERSVERGRVAFARFSEALHAHFDLEERVYFPAARGLRPELEGELQALVEDHACLRRYTDRVLAHFESGNGFASALTLDVLLERLVDHERREEQLLRRLGHAEGG